MSRRAAVEGFLSGGADEVVVWDGHDGSQTLSALTIHPKAKLLMGGMGPGMTMERGYAAVAFVGQHGRATIEVEYSTRHTPAPDAAGLAPGSEMADARTIRYRGKDFMEAWVRSRRF